MIIEPLPAIIEPPQRARRVRQKNEQSIIAAAEREFARHGFKGTSMSAIAQAAGLPKANLHYYFSNKLQLYLAVLGSAVDLWHTSFSLLDENDDPAQALSSCIRVGLEFAQERPYASRVLAMEAISGGQHLNQHFNESHQQWLQRRAAVFRAWIDAGKMDPIDPLSLIALLWGSIQFYTGLSGQLLAGQGRMQPKDQQRAGDNLIRMILQGCGLKPT